MKKSLVVLVPMVLALPMLLVVLLLGGASIESSNACATSVAAPTGTSSDSDAAGGRTSTGTIVGELPANINATAGRPVTGNLTVANANIKLRSGATPGIAALAQASPDFITLNEVGDVPLEQMRAAAPGYSAYRDPVKDTTAGAITQSLNNVIMWRADTWSLLDGGRVKIVDDDHAVVHGKQYLWDRYATWGVFSRADGAVVSVVAVHHMTNVYRAPQQWGSPAMGRIEQYGFGMDITTQLAQTLNSYGPVLIGGDMNSHPGDGPNAAAPKMSTAGYSYTKDSGIIYNFYAAPVTVAATWEISAAAVHSDHPALFTRLDMNGAGSFNATQLTSTTASGGRGCNPCPQLAASGAQTPGSLVDPIPTGAREAARAAHWAGFRGEDLVTAVAVAGVESGWDPAARNGTHHGLKQIADSHRGLAPGWITRADILRPSVNAAYAFALYERRGGTGEQRFADWIPFQTADHRTLLDTARAAIAAAGISPRSAPITTPQQSAHRDTDPATDPATATSTGTDDPSDPGSTGDVANAACAVWAMGQDLSAPLRARMTVMMQTVEGLCALSWTTGAPCTYNNQCPKVVDAMYGGAGVGRGYGDGQDVAQGIIDAGLAQAHGTGLSPAPPTGAVVSYNTGNGVGHVAIYVGNGKIFGNDYGCIANGVFGCVGLSDATAPGGTVTWALPVAEFDHGGMPAAPASAA